MSSTMSSGPTRQIGGVQLPAHGDWLIDPGHADVAFTGRHMMLTKVRGRFTDVNGTVRVAEEPSDSTVDVTIGVASVSSGDETRDAHLRSAEMFDVDTYPTATYRSTSVVWRGMVGVVQGVLTIHGVSRPVALDVVYEGYARDPWGADRAVFSARTKIDREDFGLTWNAVLETGGLLVSKEITIEIAIETILAH